MPAVPEVNVRRMLDALRSDWLPSIPATDPLTVVGKGPRQDRNSEAISSLVDSVKATDAFRVVGISRADFNQPSRS